MASMRQLQGIQLLLKPLQDLQEAGSGAVRLCEQVQAALRDGSLQAPPPTRPNPQGAGFPMRGADIGLMHVAIC